MSASRRAGLAVAGALGAVLLLAGPAAAHDTLVSVTPDDQTTVSASPQVVVLEFSDSVEPLGTGVVVRGSDGRVVSDGATQVSGTTVTQPLHPLTADGTYYVSYRIVSADGHPVSGTTAFVASGLGPAMTPTASVPVDVRPGVGGLSPTAVWVVLGLAAAGSVGLAVLAARRRVRA